MILIDQTPQADGSSRLGRTSTSPGGKNVGPFDIESYLGQYQSDSTAKNPWAPLTATKLLIMKRKSFADMDCPIARALEVVGDWWTPLILREVVCGGTKNFQYLENNLGIAPAVLSSRLSALVDNGLLERKRYSEHPERFEYIATSAANDFRNVLDELFDWGTKWASSPQR